MNFFLFLLPLVCSASLLPKNISSLNATSLISSLADAAPDKVVEVRDLVDDLIAAGEVDRAAATTSRDDAQGVKDAAEVALQAATAQHTETAGLLVDAEQEENRLTGEEASALAAKEDADGVKTAASDALTAAEGHLATETTRLNEEKATLERVLELLDVLLPGGSCQDVLIGNNDQGGGVQVHELPTGLTTCDNVAQNVQQPNWNDAFVVEKVPGSVGTVKIVRTDANTAWGQQLVLSCCTA